MTDIYTTSIEPAERVCPKCGPHRHGALTIIIPSFALDGRPLAGDYCLRCFAEFVLNNIPRLEP